MEVLSTEKITGYHIKNRKKYLVAIWAKTFGYLVVVWMTVHRCLGTLFLTLPVHPSRSLFTKQIILSPLLSGFPGKTTTIFQQVDTSFQDLTQY